ncbi:spore germination protein GerPC [Halobacillus seohaensis]|uniref:Spore germination protein GerPC n=1 Tax=Halobacillus seohaensis TaxID=447421 RepID=A0ABW2EJ20_9BACI
MNNYNSWDTWVQQVMEHMKEQQKMIEQLTQKIEQLQSQDQRKTVIEKIEYHFDQLKIETLEGTLQIGLTPSGSTETEIEDLYKGQNSAHHLDEFMGVTVPKHIDDLIHQRNIPLSTEHRDQMIADINNQLPERFKFHKQQNPEFTTESILERLSEEVQASVTQHLDHHERNDS